MIWAGARPPISPPREKPSHLLRRERRTNARPAWLRGGLAAARGGAWRKPASGLAPCRPNPAGPRAGRGPGPLAIAPTPAGIPPGALRARFRAGGPDPPAAGRRGERRLNPFLPGRGGPERSPALSPLGPISTPKHGSPNSGGGEDGAAPDLRFLLSAGSLPQRTTPGKRKSPAPPLGKPFRFGAGEGNAGRRPK